MSGPRRRDLVLALYPFTVGLAYTVFESPLSPLDWGIKDIRGRRKTAQSLEAAQKLIDRLQPDILVLLDFAGAQRRSVRIRRVQRLIEGHAQGQALEVHRFTRQEIRRRVSAAWREKPLRDSAVIASKIHAFGHRLPPPRKIWKTEPSRMGLFDAASLALAFYAQLDRGLAPDEVP